MCESPDWPILCSTLQDDLILALQPPRLPPPGIPPPGPPPLGMRADWARGTPIGKQDLLSSERAFSIRHAIFFFGCGSSISIFSIVISVGSFFSWLSFWGGFFLENAVVHSLGPPPIPIHRTGLI